MEIPRNYIIEFLLPTLKGFRLASVDVLPFFTFSSALVGGRSVGIVRSRTQTMEFSFLVLW
jgi:hypothetical protein